MTGCVVAARDSFDVENSKTFDFSFAYDNPTFSDRVINLRVVPEEDSKIDDASEFNQGKTSSIMHGRSPLSCLTGEFRTISPGTPPDQATSVSCSPSVKFYPKSLSLHLSSVILAAKSSFFHKLFTCGLKETCGTNPVVLEISPQEEGPVVDLLKFIYTGEMPGGVNDPEDLIKMFLVADKFGVTSCMNICLHRLANIPMTVTNACLYLSLPDSMHTHKGVATLLEASKAYLVCHFRDLERIHKSEEFLELPLVGLQTLLASDDLHVRDELTAFSAMLQWVRHHHEDIDHRRKATAKLAEFVRFPLILGDDLEDMVLKTPEMEHPECVALVKEAAWFRAYSLVRRHHLMNDTASIHRRFWQRKCNRNSVGYVYFDIHLERFQALAVGATVESATFGIGGKRFYLSARHGRRDDGTETLDIHLHLENSQNVHPEIQVSFTFYAKRWPEGQFDYLRDMVTKGFGKNASNWGYSNILGRPWAEVVQDDSKYFNAGVMSIFAEVKLLDQDAMKGPCTGS